MKPVTSRRIAMRATRGTKCFYFLIVMASMLLFFVLPVNAVVITFNSVPSSGPGNPIITTLTTDGFKFTSGHFHAMYDTSSWTVSFGGAVDNGTIYIAEEAADLGKPITMVNRLGKPFYLTGFDGAEMFLNSEAAATYRYPNASAIILSGVLFGGGTLGATFALDGIKDGPGGVNDFQSFLLPSAWTNLASVTFYGLTDAGGFGAISLDNIDVAPVPEPTTMLLLGSGLIGLAGYGRKKFFKK
jgi:hypothetical protein